MKKLLLSVIGLGALLSVAGYGYYNFVPTKYDCTMTQEFRGSVMTFVNTKVKSYPASFEVETSKDYWIGSGKMNEIPKGLSGDKRDFMGSRNVASQFFARAFFIESGTPVFTMQIDNNEFVLKGCKVI